MTCGTFTGAFLQQDNFVYKNPFRFITRKKNNNGKVRLGIYK